MALLPASIIIGTLCGVWFYLSALVPYLVPWVGFVAMSSMYYAGADKAAWKNSSIANVAGALQGAVFFYLWIQFGGNNMIVLAIVIAILCFALTIEGNIGLLSVIPGQFAGCAVYFGNLGAHNGDVWATFVNTAICMLLGNALAMLMAILSNHLGPKSAPTEAEA